MVIQLKQQHQMALRLGVLFLSVTASLATQQVRKGETRTPFGVNGAQPNIVVIISDDQDVTNGGKLYASRKRSRAHTLQALGMGRAPPGQQTVHTLGFCENRIPGC